MKKILLLLTMMAISTIGRAQVAIDLEPGGTELTWTVFENGDPTDTFFVIDNPDASGANTSSKVAQFLARGTGAPWAGLTAKGMAPFIFDETNRIVKIMVWKSVISDVGIKFETASGWAQSEIKVANTKVNEWEELTFDFTGRENPPSNEPFIGVSFFPDFKDGRGQDNTIYFDNFSYAAANTDISTGGGDVSSFCNTKVTHFGLGAEGFAYLTIANISPNSMIVEITSADNDPIDDLIVPGDVTGSPVISAKDETKQDTISVTLTWEAAAPPAEVALNILWSKVSFGGNWMLSENNVTVAFNSTCDGSGGGGGGTGEVVEVSTIDFEVGGNGADWTWEVFGSDNPPALEIVDNPSAAINTSAKVAKITVPATGASWSGTTTAGIGSFVFDAANPVIKVMVWKSVISNVGVKLEALAGWSQGEILVANTKTNEWEELTFDFTGKVNPPVEQGGAFGKVTFFPDFADNRGQENVVYFDNFVFQGFNSLDGGTGSGDPTAPTTAAPVPTHAESDVIAVYSNSYTILAGTDFNPGWGQATQYSTVDLEGNEAIKLGGLNYQGIALAGNNDVSGMTYLHLDYWTANSTALNVSLISPGPLENPVALEVPKTEWASVDILLTEFTAPKLTEIFQLKFDGNGDIYLDNIYFHKGEPTSVENDALKANGFTLSQNYPNPFNPSTNINFSINTASDVSLEVYNVMGQKLATLVQGFRSAGNHSVTFDASNLASGMYLYKLTAGNFSSVKSMMLIK
jgi:hypothetical protein